MAVPKTSQRAKLVLTSEQLQKLTPLAHSRTAPQREVQRARMLCHYHEGYSFTEIAALVHTTRRLVYECIDRALATGPEAALRDLPHGKQTHTILPEDKAWVVRSEERRVGKEGRCRWTRYQ